MLIIHCLFDGCKSVFQTFLSNKPIHISSMEEGDGRLFIFYYSNYEHRYISFFLSLPSLKNEVSPSYPKIYCCSFCGKFSISLKVCSVCFCEAYCNLECQEANWNNHKKMCHPHSVK